MGFTKLDEGILQSSIMSEPSDTFKIWIALMAACKDDGIARVSPVYLSKICCLPIETVDAALDFLQQPDPHSRSLEDEGRRVRRVDGGFYLVNYKHYRQFLYSDSPEAIRQRRHREKRDGCDMSRMSRNGRDISASVFNKNLNKNLKEEILTQWNSFAKKWSLQAIRDIELGSTREKHLLARMKRKDFDFGVLLAKIEKQPFLLGKNDKAWTITFDWIICPSNYTKIMEEQYPARILRDSKLDDTRTGSRAAFERAKGQGRQ